MNDEWDISPTWLPEHWLVEAVLSQALADLLDAEEEVRTAAEKWLRGASGKPWSAKWCCDLLGMQHVVIIECIDEKFCPVKPSHLIRRRAL